MAKKYTHEQFAKDFPVTYIHVVGEITNHETQSLEWEFIGVFSTHDLAAEACYDENCFVAKIILNQAFTEESVPHDYVYPRR